MGEKPRATRYEILFPMRLESKEGVPGFAVSRNLSTTGSLIATASELAVGAPITLRLQLRREDAERWVQGTIVRLVPNADDPHGIWPYLVAVRYAAELPDLEPLLRQHLQDAGRD